jgi:hypothetical protein
VPEARAEYRWHEIANVDEVDSPALLVYPGRAEENIRRMIAMVGDVRRPTPHEDAQASGDDPAADCPRITQLNAMIAEAEMTAACGAADAARAPARRTEGPKIHSTGAEVSADKILNHRGRRGRDSRAFGSVRAGASVSGSTSGHRLRNASHRD